MIEIREVNIEEVLKVHKNIPEFYDTILKKNILKIDIKTKRNLL